MEAPRPLVDAPLIELAPNRDGGIYLDAQAERDSLN